MILYVFASLLLAVIHALKILNKWVLWESNHPAKKSSVPKSDPQDIQLFLKQHHSYRQLEKSIQTSAYPNELIRFTNENEQQSDRDELVDKRSSVMLTINEDVQLPLQWLTTINAYSQYPYISSFQTPILYIKDENWKDRLNQVRSIRYILQIFINHQENKQIQFERMISIQTQEVVGLEKQNRLMTNPEFASHSNTPWSSKLIKEHTVLLKLYPLLIAVNIILGVTVNPIFGFLALMQLFIFTIVDFLAISNLASFYSMPKATKWYIISFAIHFKNAFTSLFTPISRGHNN